MRLENLLLNQVYEINLPKDVGFTKRNIDRFEGRLIKITYIDDVEICICFWGSVEDNITISKGSLFLKKAVFKHKPYSHYPELYL